MIIDTNALSAFFDGDSAVVDRFSQAHSIYLPVIVLGEYRFGLRGSAQRALRESHLNGFCRSCQVLGILESTTAHYATIRHHLRIHGRPIPENDIWIAALALEFNLPILSRDRHFDQVPGVVRLDW